MSIHIHRGLFVPNWMAVSAFIGEVVDSLGNVYERLHVALLLFQPIILDNQGAILLGKMETALFIYVGLV